MVAAAGHHLLQKRSKCRRWILLEAWKEAARLIGEPASRLCSCGSSSPKDLDGGESVKLRW
jgi:hypothetical protein